MDWRGPTPPDKYKFKEVPPAPPADFRHHESDPKEPLRKESTQCQNCFKSRADGATMSRCGACRVDLYCSKECQRQAWPVHKARCKLNQQAHALEPSRAERLKILRDFTQKHRPTIAESGLRALDLCVDPSRAQRDLLVIYVRSRPRATRVETQFYATGADIMPIDSFPQDKREEMYSQLKYASDLNIKHGALGAMFVVLSCWDEGIANIAPVGFLQDVLSDMKPGQAWRDWLMTGLNEGIVQ